MKKNSLLFICAVLLINLIPNRANAQWYSSYGVTNLNELTEPQLRVAMDKAVKISGAGITCTVIGGLAFIIGGVIYSSGLSNIMNGSYTQITQNTQNAMAGAYVMGGGAGLVGIGIPLWIVGAMRKADVEIALAKFPAKVSLAPCVIKDPNHYSLGLSLAFTF